MALAVAGGGPKKLERDLDHLLDDPALAGAVVSMEVRSLDTGRIWAARDGHTRVVPASVTKVQTALAVLDVLGPEATVSTRILGTGVVTDGVLHGDLLLVGAGDPSLGVHGVSALFEGWAQAVHDAGVTAIDGDVVADGRGFDPHRLGRGWTWDDALWSYSAPITALQLNHNVASVRVSAGPAVGAPLVVDAGALSPCVPLNVRAGDGALGVDRPFGTSVTVISGGLPPGTTRTLRVTLPSPDACVATLMTRALADLGVSVSGVARVALEGDESGGEALVETPSPPLSVLLETMLQRSDNLYAESLARWLGADDVRGGFSGAMPVIRDTLRGAGVADDEVVLADGSGLSRYGLVTADALARLFVYADARPYSPLWHALLPVAGESGTLTRRMVGGPAQGNAHGKTGSMTGVFNLVTYATTEGGDRVVVVILTNGVVHGRQAVRDLQDAIVERVVRTGHVRRRR